MKAAIRIAAYIAGALRGDVSIPKDILIAAYITKAIKFADYITKATWTNIYIAKAIKIALFVIAKDILNQGLFCHDQVSSGKFLEFFNL